MDPSIQKALNDKLYDKRKGGALELEALVRESINNGDHEKIEKIIHQLCHDYAYAVHQQHARNGGLIGLAAASIALGSEVARYLEEIVPPVLACFNDQDARVRYYACESMYNIAKVAKGEILVYFNEVFDALCKLAADSEMSVKNGAELLDRLVKDIVSESAASYVSVLRTPEESIVSPNGDDDTAVPPDIPTAFSLPKFIPLLQERINVINPFTRTFLVSWITLLDSIPDLELVSHLPSFLGGLFKFLSDPNQDVHTQTQAALERFLAEVKKIARIKRGIAESKKSQLGDVKRSDSSIKSGRSPASDASSASDVESTRVQGDGLDKDRGSDAVESGSDSDTEQDSGTVDGDWIPGQDVEVDHTKILDILLLFLTNSHAYADEEVQLTTLRWIDSFFEISPEDMLQFVPRLLSQVLPAVSSDMEPVRSAANRVNASLKDYIDSTVEDEVPRQESFLTPAAAAQPPPTRSMESKQSLASSRVPSPKPGPELDYEGCVNALTLQFLNEHVDTRVAALGWLIMLHHKAPRKMQSINDGTFPALLKTLSDPAEAVVTRDLQLLSEISRNSDDSFFTSFMVNLLKLFATDRRLLGTRGNLIIRQLCNTLSAERIYRTLADCLEKDEDIEFASIMVQNLNNNLITAPELADLRKRLRNLEAKDGRTFFQMLFRAWCHNSVATFSLCLLAQAYEQAYHLLQIFADLEMTVDMLIQIDKLVQLLESPVFTYLRLQLLEPDRFPFLYKCLYGLLMLLPQSSAFAALKNRLNSVSAIGYLHGAPRTAPTTPAVSSFERTNRLKAREEDQIKWMELLDKFKAVQERARRYQRGQNHLSDETMASSDRTSFTLTAPVQKTISMLEGAGVANGSGRAARPVTGQTLGRLPPAQQTTQTQQVAGTHSRARSSLSHLGRVVGGVGGRKSKR
ncbi:ARM repeat-containing protein [Rhizodiscina lignyota]|uniref:ARM repeat-containing protein n=1 Tax=Rhizodiscina lignyota TaxID=1504668 RepID=A0A9P4M8W7_9PEZI|nr:ARM repeat-containing protein [Rhizodiscina lignyota]